MFDYQAKALEILKDTTSDYISRMEHHSQHEERIAELKFPDRVSLFAEEDVRQIRIGEEKQCWIREYTVFYEEQTWVINVVAVYSHDGENELEYFVEVSVAVPQALKIIIHKYPLCKLGKT